MADRTRRSNAAKVNGNTYVLSTCEDDEAVDIDEFTAAHPGVWLASYVDTGDSLIVILQRGSA